jgi:hypothetical protein
MPSIIHYSRRNAITEKGNGEWLLGTGVAVCGISVPFVLVPKASKKA